MALTVDPSRRSQTRDKTASLAFGTGDVEERKRKFLGNTGALDTQLDRLAGGLEFDASRERKSRQGMLEQQAQTSRERLARQFAISPESIQSGRSLRGFGTIEQGLGQNLAGLESELSQRAGQENRANLAAVQGLVGQRQQSALAAGQAQLQGLDALTQQLNQAEQLSQGGRQLDIQDRSLDLEGEIQRRQLGLQEGQAIGQLLGQETLGGRQQGLQEELGRGELDVAQQALSLQKEFGREELGLQARAQTESEATGAVQRDVAQRAQTEAEATGAVQRDVAGRAQTLAETEQADRIQLARDELFGGQGIPAQHFADAGALQEALALTFNKSQGQEGFNEGFDINDDGIIDYDDFIAISGSRNADGSFDLAAKGEPLTVAQQQLAQDATNTARSLGIEEDKLTNAMAQFKSTMTEETRQFNSSFAGVQLDAEGEIVSRATMEEVQVPVSYSELNYDEQQQVGQRVYAAEGLMGTTGIPAPTHDEMARIMFGNFRTEIDTTPHPVTSQERQVINRQLAQMDQAMNTNARDLLSQAGVDVNRLSDEKKLEVASLVMATMFGPNVSFGGNFSSPRTGANPLNALIGAAGTALGGI